MRASICEAAPYCLRYLHIRLRSSKLLCHAGVAELVDAHASGACEVILVKVQVLSPAPNKATFWL